MKGLVPHAYKHWSPLHKGPCGLGLAQQQQVEVSEVHPAVLEIDKLHWSSVQAKHGLEHKNAQV